MRRRGLGAGRLSLTWLCLGMALVATPVEAFAPVRARPSTLSTRRDYRIDRARSRVTVETHSTSLLSYSARTQLLAARDFRGQVSLVPGMLETTVVDFTVRADSLTILDQMSEASRRDIDLAIHRSLDAARFPRIVFHSSNATADAVGPDIHDVAAAGTLDLHGVRRPLTVAAQVSLEGDILRIRGACTLRQTDHGLVPFTLGNGTINVADDVTLTFDLVAIAPQQRD